jgi:hypothetical protein
MSLPLTILANTLAGGEKRQYKGLSAQGEVSR